MSTQSAQGASATCEESGVLAPVHKTTNEMWQPRLPCMMYVQWQPRLPYDVYPRNLGCMFLAISIASWRDGNPVAQHSP